MILWKCLRSLGKRSEAYSVSSSAALFLGADIELFDLSVYPWISSASLDFLLKAPVCQWWHSGSVSAAQLTAFIRIFYYSTQNGINYKADIGPVMTHSHHATGSLLEQGIKTSICFWSLAGCSLFELGNDLSFLVLNCPFIAVGEAAIPKWKLELAYEEPRNRWGAWHGQTRLKSLLPATQGENSLELNSAQSVLSSVQSWFPVGQCCCRSCSTLEMTVIWAQNR